MSMVKEIINQWEDRKEVLKNYFRTTPQSEYGEYIDIVKAIFRYVIEGYNIDKITVVDDGDWQGTQLFLIPLKTYQPCASEYLITHTYYGSCSGCDTLLGIRDFGHGLPSEAQVKEYMTLALHLVQKLQRIQD